MSEISSGLVAVAWRYISPLGTVRKLQDRQPCLNNPEEHHWTPLVRLSDAEAIIAAKDAEIESARRTADYWKANHLSGNELIEKQSAALKLAREKLLAAALHVKPTCFDLYDELQEALAAIDALKGE